MRILCLRWFRRSSTFDMKKFAYDSVRDSILVETVWPSSQMLNATVGKLDRPPIEGLALLSTNALLERKRS